MPLGPFAASSDVTTPLRVLHLEDSTIDADVVRYRLAVGGFSCDILVVKDQGSFETALAQRPFELILLDYNLAGYDGISALKHAQLTRPDIPVILISGTVGDEEAVRCLHFGATDYLLKSRLDRLVPAVHRALRESEAGAARRRAEVSLADSEARKAAILDSVLDCIVTMDAGGTLIEFNAAAARTFGYTKTQAIGRPLLDLIIPARFREMYRAGLRRYLETGEGGLIGAPVEIQAMRSDGTELPVELAITATNSRPPIFTGVLRDITARKQAEATRASLAAIVDSSDDAIFAVALDDTILTWNGGAERLYGYAASEVIGANRSIIVPAGHSDELSRITARAQRGEAGEPFETKRVRKDGSLVDISLLISPMMDSAGVVTGVSAIARDITSLKNSEAAVRVERDRAKRYLDMPEVILLALDRSGAVTLANRYACSILEWSAEDLVGRDWIETCVPARLREAVRQSFRALFAGDLSVIEQPILTRSGGERLDRMAEHPAARRPGTGDRHVQLRHRHHRARPRRGGVAGRRRADAVCPAERQRRHLGHRLHHRRPRLVRNARSPVRPAARNFWRDLRGVHGEDSSRRSPDRARHDREGDAAGIDFQMQNRSLWPDGTVRWLSGAGRFQLGEDDEPLRGVGISLDLTDARALEAQYQQAQKMEAIGQLAAGVAHDFNNLLTVILGFCELLFEDLDPAEPRHADITEIQKAGQRGAALTRQLLTFSRKEIIEPTLLDVNAVVANMRVLLGRLIGEDVEIVLAPRARGGAGEDRSRADSSRSC